ncbi:hypothetical protein PILCRDRAFT_803339 [Piloderma croceum F 1598]|uniref:Uncharacterized protein n=1 Tax=Piloderma croceum (strain F 1598) TaxID=765440 RepID=A0A0C3EXU3_PILCF|nr:hypothetical protein PILCRDRAFT_803339 [Piloderma croceum F 1598]
MSPRIISGLHYWILVFYTKAFSQIVVTIYHSRAILSLRKSALQLTLMSWRSSGSYHRRTLKIAIPFNGGPAEERNSPVCHGMLEISSLFLGPLLLSSESFQADVTQYPYVERVCSLRQSGH